MENVSIWWRHHVLDDYNLRDMCCRADFKFAPSQWETALLCNDVFHWLGASLKSALCCHWSCCLAGIAGDKILAAHLPAIRAVKRGLSVAFAKRWKFPSVTCTQWCIAWWSPPIYIWITQSLSQQHECTANKIWWLCLVPTLTTRFVNDVGYRIVKHLIWL